jgi:acyl-CoA thioester hydrolase
MALEEFYHATPIQIRFNDVDGFEHVNNTIIQEYFDIGRVHYLREAFGGELWKNDKVVLIVSIKTDFFKQTLPDDQVRVLTRVYHLGGKSLRMLQWLVKEGDAEPTATCDSVMAGYDQASQSGMLIPDDWRRAFDRMEKGRLIRGTAL